jgi:hypothetical protein
MTNEVVENLEAYPVLPERWYCLVDYPANPVGTRLWFGVQAGMGRPVERDIQAVPWGLA